MEDHTRKCISAGRSIAAHLTRRPFRSIAAAAFFLFLVVQYHFLDYHVPRNILAHRAWDKVTISGFINSGSTTDAGCKALQEHVEISQGAKAILKDDMLQIAHSLESHPLIDYSGQDVELAFENVVEKTWGRMAGSGVWLEEQGVYLVVSRVFFYDKGVKRWPIMSFLRGQIYDADWVEIRDYTLKWQDKIMVFPLIFDIEAPYVAGGCFYGPEDPRIIIEHNVPGAEPVITFNMVANLTSVQRSMFLFRPFSGELREFTIGDREQQGTEKNWAPFFHQSSLSLTVSRRPSPIIYFVYNFEPVRILRCRLDSGVCHFAFEQDVEHDKSEAHDRRGSGGSMRGGTNFELVHSSPNTLHDENATTHTYLGIPRTNTQVGCVDGDVNMYRPQITLLTGNATHFWLTYASGPLDLGEETATSDPCGKGAIVIANSIARIEWNDRDDQSGVTVSMSVNDQTVQIVKLKNILALINDIVGRADGRMKRSSQAPIGKEENDLGRLVSGRDVLLCSVASAADYAMQIASPFQGRPRHLD